jgi:hypothetical protein
MLVAIVNLLEVQNTNTFSPSAAWYFLFHLLFVFSLYERKNEQQKEDKVPLCRRLKTLTA